MARNQVKVPGAPKWLKKNTVTGKYELVKSSKLWGNVQRFHAMPDFIKTKSEAIEYGERKILEWKGFIKVERPKEMITFEHVAELVEKNYRAKVESKDREKATLDNFLLAIKYVKPWFKANCPNICDITAYVCNEKYVMAQRAADKENKRPKNRYLGNDMKAIREVLKLARELEYTEKNFEIKNVDAEADEGTGLFLPWKNQKDLLENGTLEMRVKTALGLMSMRNTETNKLRLEQIRLEAGVIEIKRRQTKMKKVRTIYLSPLAIKLLKQYIPTLPKGSAFLYPNPATGSYVLDHKTAWGTHKKNADVEARYRFHDLRHTAMTIFGFLGLPYPIIGAHAGMSQRIYETVYLKQPARSQKELQELRRQIKKNIPLYLPKAWRGFINSAFNS